jgi:ribose transport system permease protein
MQKTILFAKTYGILVVTVALFVLLALTTDGFFSERNMRNILDQQSGVLIAACFMTMAIIAGNFDISVGAVYVATPLVALLVENATGSIPLGILAGLGAGAVMGLINGFAVTRLKVNSFIATLATSFIFFGTGYLVSDRAIMRPESDGWRDLARSRIFELTSATWIAIAVVIFASILLTRTRFGRNVYATGANREPRGLPVSPRTGCR